MRIFSIILAFLITTRSAWVGAEGGEPVVLGLLTESTGPTAINGLSCRDGFEVARKWLAPGDKIGRFTLTFMHGDHQGIARVGVSEFKKLIGIDKATAVIVTRSQIGMAVNPISKEMGIPLLGVVGHKDFVAQNPAAFRTYPSVDLEGPQLARGIIREGRKRLAEVTLEDEWTLSLRDALVGTYKSLGGEVVFSDTITPEEIDYSPLITRMKLSRPDAVLANLNVNNAGTFIRRLREIGVDAPIYANFWARYPDVIQAAGEANIEGLSFVEANLKKPNFLAALKAEFVPGEEREASAATYSCYSGLVYILRALEKLAAPISSASLVQELSRASELQLMDEKLAIIDREIQFDVSIKKIKAGLVVQE